jgi:predicted adenylyl cyclase CyaB
MPRNVEIKARVEAPNVLRRRAAALSTSPVEVLRQVDTFYVVPEGRLKLRVLGPDACELIFYDRRDISAAKASDYVVVRSDDPEGFARILSSVLEVRGVVVKTRFLYRVGQTRIHVDDVEGLGSFMELEVVLGHGQTVDDGAKIAERLMVELGLETAHRVAGAYIDLLERKGG